MTAFPASAIAQAVVGRTLTPYERIAQANRDLYDAGLGCAYLEAAKIANQAKDLQEVRDILNRIAGAHKVSA